MARFAFVSHPRWGHIDFGGRSFARTAQELTRRGHEVVWLLAREEPKTDALALADHLVAEGLAVEWIDGPLSLLDARSSNARAASLLSARLAGFDACAIDRLAVLAGAAADQAGVPWAAVGTDGGAWSFAPGLGVLPSQGEDSVWAASRLLNLSFFPGRYFGARRSEVAHFLGGDAPGRAGPRTSVLATLGTSFDAAFRERMLARLDQARRIEGGDWHILAGGSWEPYDVAFARAVLAIGHGGNAFLWQGIREGIPVIAISSAVGDQTFGARAVERMGIGRALESAELATPEWLARSVSELQTDGAVKARAAQLSRLLASGGGVSSAATLLERLARERAPIPDCVQPCCCVEPLGG